MTQDKEIPYGSDASGGKFECVDCGETIEMPSSQSLPPCPKSGDGSHSKNAWKAISGRGDSNKDPYPE